MSAADASGILDAANATRDNGHFSEALKIYQELLADPSVPASATAVAQLGVGECMLALGNPSDAKQIFHSLAANAELHASALQGEGLALLALGQPEAATKALREASEADPKLWRTWNALGDLADVKRQPDEAATLYAKALALNPDSAPILNNIGYSRLMADDPAKAIEAFRKALELDPKSETIRNNLRLAVAENGDYPEAIRAAGRDQLPIVLNNVGYVAMRRRDWDTAEAYFAQAMEASSSYASVTAKNLEQLKAERALPQ